MAGVDPVYYTDVPIYPIICVRWLGDERLGARRAVVDEEPEAEPCQDGGNQLCRQLISVMFAKDWDRSGLQQGGMGAAGVMG